MKNVITSTPGSKVTNQLEQSGVPIARHQSRSQRSSTTGLTFSRPLQILMMVLVLLLLATSAVSSLSIERVEDGDSIIFILTGPELSATGYDLLFGLDRDTFEETTANLEEKELLEEDLAAFRISFEESMLALEQERKATKEDRENYARKVRFWRVVAAVCLTTAVTIGVLR